MSLARCDIAATSEPKDCADRIINQGRLAVAVCGVELETNLRRSLHNHKGIEDILSMLKAGYGYST